MPAPSEHEEAVKVATYLNALAECKQIIAYTKVATEFFGNWGLLRKLQAEGMRGGHPDYVILTKKGLIFVELKKKIEIGKRGKPLKNNHQATPEQLLWIDTLNGYNSKEIVATVACGADEAIKYIQQYI